jgi:uncharacterized membrane protein
MKLFDKQDKKWFHYLFGVGLVIKGFNGFLEIIGGTLLFTLNEKRLTTLVKTLASDELSEDPHDKVINFFLQLAQHFSLNDRLFVSIYLLLHGLVKLGLVLALLQRKVWAYPMAMGVFGIFIAYQLYKFAYNQSPFLLVISTFDAFVIIATWLELKKIQLHSKNNHAHM